MAEGLCLITVGSTISNIRKMLNEAGIGFDLLVDICNLVAVKPEGLQHMFLLRLSGETQESIAEKLGVRQQRVSEGLAIGLADVKELIRDRAIR